MRALALVLLTGCRGFFDPQQPCDGGGGSGGPAVVYRQAATKVSGTSSTFIAAPLPLDIVDGDVLVVLVGFQSPAAISGLADDAGNSYMAAIGPTVTTGGWQAQTFVTRSAAAAGGTNNVKVSLTQAVNIRLAVVEYGNIDPSQPIDTSVAKIGASSSTVTPGSMTTTHAHDMLVVAATSDGALSGTLPAFNVRESAGDYVIEDLEVTDVGTYAPEAPVGTNSNWVMQMIALRGL